MSKNQMDLYGLIQGLVSDVMDLKDRVLRLENKPKPVKKVPVVKGAIEELKNTQGALELLKGVGVDTQKIWVETYGLELIQRELPKILAWCASNPKKANKRDWPRFINNWLSKAFEKDSPAIMKSKIKVSDPEFY